MSNYRKANHLEDRKLEKLIERRRDWVRSSRENKFDFDSILAGLYNDPSHFIYELLQNAEDEGATEVKFELFEDRLDAYHNGKNFDLKDIDGVTGIGISKKKNDLIAIGKFGVGFKSVFAVTETPYIYSGKYKIRIEDFVVPSMVNDNGQVNGTLIRLPFNHKLRSREEVFKLISEKLVNIGLKTLLFLKNIKGIQWQIPFSSGNYSKSSKYFQKIKTTKKVTLKSSNITEEYIVVEKPINIGGKKLKVEVAYKLDKDKKGKRIIAQEPNSKLVVFFPTDKPTYLNFVIQGPYKTTPNRENIPLEDKQNKTIIEETVNLVAESLPVIKKLGFLDVNFLNILPLKLEGKENEPIYLAIYKKIRDKLLSEKLLPVSGGKYARVGDSLLARGRELTEFLDNKDIEKLFSKQHWLNTDITHDKTPELRDYLINELKVEEVDFEIVAEKITIEFLQTKSDKWMVDFYKRLLRQPALWNDRDYSPGILRKKPIIRLETGKHIAPFDDNGKIQVYLPAKLKSKYKTIKSIFLKDKNSLKFFKELGIKEPDLFADVKEHILPKYQTGSLTKDEEYFEDIEKLLRAYETVQMDRKDEFIEKLSEAHFVDSFNNITGEHRLLKPTEVYFENKDLKEYFDGYNCIYFVSDEPYKRFGEEKLGPLLKELGVEDKPRRIEIAGNWSWEEIIKLHSNKGSCRDFRDYEYEGLKYFIKEITAEKSLLLWKLLIKNVEKEGQSFFKGKYIWDHYGTHDSYFEPVKFFKTLRQKAWFLDKNNNFRKSCDITFSELSDGYIKESPNLDILLKTLEFKSDGVDKLSENERQMYLSGKLLAEKGYSIEDIEGFPDKDTKEPKSQQENEVSVWTPECEPDEFEIPIKETSLSKIITPDLKNQEPKTEPDESNLVKVDEVTEENITGGTVSAQNKKRIGEQGEKTVYSSLKKGYKKDVFISIEETSNGFKAQNGNGETYEVIWLNKHCESGKGYDLKIMKGGVVIKYIEVKSKMGTKAEIVSASGTQWEFARSLFDRGEGDKYSFYVVTNTGKPDAEIHSLINPIKLWREGKLYAHPVNFKL